MVLASLRQAAGPKGADWPACEEQRQEHNAVQHHCCPGEQNLWTSPGKQCSLLYVVVVMHQV